MDPASTEWIRRPAVEARMSDAKSSHAAPLTVAGSRCFLLSSWLYQRRTYAGRFGSSPRPTVIDSRLDQFPLKYVNFAGSNCVTLASNSDPGTCFLTNRSGSCLKRTPRSVSV